MALKDLHKADKSIFAVAIVLIVLVGLSLVLIIANSEPADAPSAGNISGNSVTGVITELTEDCVRREAYVDGRIVTEGAVTCDGGSYLLVGDQRIQTSAGFVAESEYFEVRIRDFNAGDSVEVIYNERSPGIFDLNCEECAIRAL